MIAYKFSLTKNVLLSAKLPSSLSFSHPQLFMAPAQVHADWSWFELTLLENSKKDVKMSFLGYVSELLRLSVFIAVFNSSSPDLDSQMSLTEVNGKDGLMSGQPTTQIMPLVTAALPMSRKDFLYQRFFSECSISHFKKNCYYLILFDVKRKYWRVFLSSFSELIVKVYWSLKVPLKSAGIDNLFPWKTITTNQDLK